MATFPSKVNYATGDILTSAQMNDIGGAINLLDGAQYAGAKNRVLNSNYSVWQRGTSISIAASTQAYSADRWITQTNANQAITISRQATGDTTNLPNIQYCARFQRNSGQTGTGAMFFMNLFESVNAIPLAGKAVTISFYARAGANYSAASSALTYALVSGTGTDQNPFNVSYTGQATVTGTTATLTTTWQRFSISGTMAATATECYMQFGFTPVGTASTNDYYEVTGAQIEAANTASPYAPNSTTYQGELAACQRYYQRFTAIGSNTYARFATGWGTSTTVAYIAIPTKVPLRTAATTLDYSLLNLDDQTSGNWAVTSATFSGYATDPNLIGIAATAASGLITYRPYSLIAQGLNSYIGFSAEL
jgi:hypothetical protein